MSKVVVRCPEVRIRPVLSGASLLLLPLALLFFISSVNQALFLFLNERLTLWQGGVFWALLTNLGDGFFLFPLSMVLFWRQPRQQLAVILSMILLALVINVAKSLIGAPRPGALLDLELFSVVGPLLTGDSVPSGHAGTAFLLVGLGLIHLGRSLKAILLVVMTLVCLSRIAVGAHWPFDVVVGAWLGLVCAALGTWLSHRLGAGFKTRLVFIALGLAAVGVLPVYHNGFQEFAAVRLAQYVLAAISAVTVLSEIMGVYRDYSCHFRPSSPWLRGILKAVPHRFIDRIARLFRFALVGASGFVVDMAFYTLFSGIPGVPHLLARASSYWCSASWNWFWNRTFTFGDRSCGERLPQWGKYLLMCAISFIPNWGTYYLLTTWLPFFAEYKRLALVFGVGAGLVFNFTIASLVIFANPVSAGERGKPLASKVLERGASL